MCSFYFYFFHLQAQSIKQMQTFAAFLAFPLAPVHWDVQYIQLKRVECFLQFNS